MSTESTDAPKMPRQTKKPKKLLMAALPVAVVAVGLWMWLDSGRYESTDNAALQQARITVAANVSGRITRVFATDSTIVTAGTPLFEVDPEPYRLALAKAETALAQARLQIDQLRANYQVALAQEQSARDSVAYFDAELKRQQAITVKGVGTASALDSARHDANSAHQTLNAATQSVDAALAALGGDPDIKTDEHPTVRAALVARDSAAYDLSLTTVKAAADGIVYQASNFKPGQYVSAGATLFSLVETGDTWVTANFKETQIGRMQPGDTATVVFDTFPGHDFKAVVESVGAGTGAEFSVLPAQNATGNWVKVTQRVPVKLRLSQNANLSGLRTGLSAEVTVDTRAATRLSALFGTRAEAKPE